MSTCAVRPAAATPSLLGRRERLRDPSFPIAVRLLERHPKYREAAQACPDLADPRTAPQAKPVRCNVILVHGGLSNGLACFGDNLIGGRAPLLQPKPDVSLFRYEHDTWLPIQENVVELVDLMQRKLRGESLLLIGFSRGGVVATRAAVLLRDTGALAPEAGDRVPGAHRDVTLMTFGSPHRGFATADVVRLMPRIGYCLQYFVSTAIMHLPPPFRLAIFLASVRRLSFLPPGIAELTPDNPEFERFIHSGAGRWIGQRLHAYGGSPAEPKWLPARFRALKARPVPGIGDGAVSLRSATAYGRERRELRGCGHDDYFSHAEIRATISRQLYA